MSDQPHEPARAAVTTVTVILILGLTFGVLILAGAFIVSLQGQLSKSEDTVDGLNAQLAEVRTAQDAASAQLTVAAAAQQQCFSYVVELGDYVRALSTGGNVTEALAALDTAGAACAGTG